MTSIKNSFRRRRLLCSFPFKFTTIFSQLSGAVYSQSKHQAKRGQELSQYVVYTSQVLRRIWASLAWTFSPKVTRMELKSQVSWNSRFSTDSGCLLSLQMAAIPNSFLVTSLGIPFTSPLLNLPTPVSQGAFFLQMVLFTLYLLLFLK